MGPVLPYTRRGREFWCSKKMRFECTQPGGGLRVSCKSEDSCARTSSFQRPLPAIAPFRTSRAPLLPSCLFKPLECWQQLFSSSSHSRMCSAARDPSLKEGPAAHLVDALDSVPAAKKSRRQAVSWAQAAKSRPARVHSVQFQICAVWVHCPTCCQDSGTDSHSNRCCSCSCRVACDAGS